MVHFQNESSVNGVVQNIVLFYRKAAQIVKIIEALNWFYDSSQQLLI